MFNVCWQCGDVGLSVALVYCIKCKSAARHSYCLDEIPEDFTAKITWFCEDCRRKSPNSASKAKFPPTSLGIIDHGSQRAEIEPKKPCQEIGSANDHLINPQDQHPISNVRIGSTVYLDNHVSYALKKETLSCAISSALGAINSSACFKLKEDGIEKCGNEKPKRKILILSDKDKLDNSQPPVDAQGTNIPVKRLACTSIEPSDNKTSKWTSSCGTNAFGAVGSSACLQFKGGQMEEQGKEKPMGRMIIQGMDKLEDIQPPIEGQGSSIKFAAKRLSGTSINASDKQIIGSTSSCSIGALGDVRSSACFRVKEGEIKDHVKKKQNRRRLKRRRLIPLARGQKDKFHPDIFCRGTNIPVVAKRVPGTSVDASDRQIIGRTKTCDELGTVRSSVCFDLKEGEIDGFRKVKPESRRLILPTKDELNNLHPVIDRRGTSMKFAAEGLAGTFVNPSDTHTIGWIDTKAQIKFPCQLTLPSLPVVSHVWSGCFNINKAEIVPLKAHLSSRACIKVCNFARKLPLVLHMQKLPRFVAWPNSFKVSSPTADNIALYFFPESDRVETLLDELVDDIINKDLLLRFEFDEVELLVFSSFLLPQEHQRFFGKYYAWGVFKPRSVKICSMPAGSHTIPGRVLEGYHVGKALKPVRRSEVVDHDGGLLKDSAQETNDFTSRRSLIRPGEAILRVTTDSTAACEDGKLQTLHRKPSGHVDLHWHRVGQLDDCENKFSNDGLKMSKNYTSELKKVPEEREERLDMMNSRGRLRIFRESEGGNWDVDDKYTDDPKQEQSSELKNLDKVADLDISRKKHNNNTLKISQDTEEGEVCDGDSQHGISSSLKLFPLHVENMSIAVRLRTVKEDIDLKVGLGIPSFDYHHGA